MMRAVLHSSVLLKAVMAVSGLLMVGFLLGHMAGNLLIFLGQDALNSYAAKLHSMPSILWTVRIGLLVCLLAHVFSGIKLAIKNRQSRSTPYKVKHPNASTLASRSMAITGCLILLYICYHLAHFTVKWTHPEFQQNPGDVYGMVVTSFQHPLIAFTYVLSMAMVGAHLYHGIKSAFDSLGFYHPFYSVLVCRIAKVTCVLLALGFSSVPVCVYFGLIS